MVFSRLQLLASCWYPDGKSTCYYADQKKDEIHCVFDIDHDGIILLLKEQSFRSAAPDICIGAWSLAGALRVG